MKYELRIRDERKQGVLELFLEKDEGEVVLVAEDESGDIEYICSLTQAGTLTIHGHLNHPFFKKDDEHGDSILVEYDF